MSDKLDKIIDLLVAQNNLLTHIMMSLKSTSDVAVKNTPPITNRNMQLSDIKADIDKKIQEAKREAKAKILEMQNSTKLIDTIVD